MLLVNGALSRRSNE